MDGVRELVSKHDWDAVQAPMLFQQNNIYLINVDSLGCLFAPVGLLDIRRLRLQDFLRNFLPPSCWTGRTVVISEQQTAKGQKRNQMASTVAKIYIIYHQKLDIHLFLESIIKLEKWSNMIQKAPDTKVITQLGLLFPSSFDPKGLGCPFKDQRSHLCEKRHPNPPPSRNKHPWSPNEQTTVGWQS